MLAPRCAVIFAASANFVYLRRMLNRVRRISLLAPRVFRNNSALAVLFSFLVAALGACDGVDSRDTETATTIARNTNAFRSLRLGQTESPNSPVATTAGANNGEAIIILNRAPGSITVDHVLYVTPTSQVARITYADGNLPSSAEGGGLKLGFGSYKADTVEVTITASDGKSAVATVPLSDTVIKFLAQISAPTRAGRAAESPAVLRELYMRAIIGVQLFGCGSVTAFAQTGIPIPPELASLSQSACTSLLVDLLRAFISLPDFAAQVITGIDEEPSCDFSSPDWINNFDNAVQCALGVGGDLLDAILQISPNVQISVVPTPEPTPEPTPRPRPPEDDDDDDDEDEPDEPDEPELVCSLGFFDCSNGQQTCNEFACNGASDCIDGSDESNTLCTTEVLCCIGSGGCPGESAGACAPGCCCCGAGRKCSDSPFLDGCIADDT